MKTVEKETVIEFEEKKSKFIGYIKPVFTVEEAEKFIASIREMHPNATHNVPLYRVVEEGQEYFKYNEAIVATRYFGGIKLGAGGLIRNYAKTAKIAVNEAGIVEYKEKSLFIIDYDYEYTGEVESFLNMYKKEFEIEIVEKNYSSRVTMKIKADSEIEEKLNEMNKLIVIKL